MSIKQTIVKNVIWSSASKFIVPLIGFFLVPYLISQLGILEFGLIGLAKVFAIGGYIGILEFGFQSVIVKYTAEYHQKDENQKLCRLINSAFFIFLVIGAFGLLAGIAGIRYFPGWFHVPVDYIESFQTALWVVFGCYLFQFPDFVFRGVIAGLQRFDLLKGMEIGYFASYALVTVIIVFLGGNFLHIILWSSALSFVQFIHRIWIVFRLVPNFSLRRKHFDMGVLREVKSMAKYNFISKLSSLLFNQTDRIVIGLFLGPVFIGFYEVLVRLPQLIKQMSGLGNEAVMPAASQVFAITTDRSLLQRLYVRGLNFNLCLYYPIVLAAIFFSRPFLQVWVGNDFVHLTILLQCLLIWNLAIPLVNFGPAILLGMNRRLKHTTIGTWIGTLTKLLVTLLFIQHYELKAVVAGTVISIFVILPWYTAICLKEFNVQFTTFIREILLILATAIVPLAILSGLDYLLVTEGLGSFILKGCVWCGAYWLVLYFTALHPKNRGVVKDVGSRFLPNVVR